MIDGNSIVKNAKSCQNTLQKFCRKIPYRCREIIKKPKRFNSVMTSMTMFTQSHNPSNSV